MSVIIAITGVTGAGKTTIANRFASAVFEIHAAPLLCDAARRAFPFLRHSQQNRWDAWPVNPATMDIDRLLNITLRKAHESLEKNRGPVLVEGCVISQDWFRIPLFEQIRSICRFGPEIAIHQFDLIPPARVLQRQIFKRGVRNQVEKFSDLSYVQQQIEQARRRASTGWKRFSDTASLELAIRNALAQHGFVQQEMPFQRAA
jgi:hypothetical protein